MSLVKMLRWFRLGLVIGGLLVVARLVQAAETPTSSKGSVSTNAPAWLSQPLSLADCLNLTLEQNSAIRKSQKDLEAAHGVVVQTRAVVVPKVRAQSNYQLIDRGSIDKFPFPGAENLPYPDQSWSATVQIVQSIYEGGRMSSALRTAKLTREQAVLAHQIVIADTLLDVRVAFSDVLLAIEQIKVQQASVALLTKELEDNERRYQAGTVPRFNYLRAGVQLTNALPRLFRAENAYNIAKNNLSNLLGYNVPASVGENIPLRLVGELKYEPYEIELPVGIAQALERRLELRSLRKIEALQKEGVISAQAGYKPSVQAVAGYGSRNSSFSRDLTRDVSGWFVGGQMSWNLFDGMLTKGKVEEARARREKTEEEIKEMGRRVELEVRTAYSNFKEAKRVLDAQQQVINLAQEALDLSRARYDAGTGTQLDVLNSETSLTETRSTRAQALRDYVVAQARLERAIGQNVTPQAGRN